MSDDWNIGDRGAYDPKIPPCGHCHDGDGNEVLSRIVVTVSKVVPFVGQPVGIDFFEVPATTFGEALYCSCQFRKVRPDEQSGDADDWELILDSVKRRVDA